MQHNETKIHGEKSNLGKLKEYLAEFVYGGIDGSVTTFAVVAGASGADLNVSIVLILGFANLVADGFAMSVGSYLSTKSERDEYHKHEQIEYWEVDNLPEKEREEMREIYREKGFEGELLEKIVEIITEDRDRWVQEMMKDELGMMKSTKSPMSMALATYISFILIGLVPLTIYVIDYYYDLNQQNLFLYSCLMTSFTFMLIGLFKSYVTNTNKFRSVVETLFLGGLAAGISYFVGDILEKWLG